MAKRKALSKKVRFDVFKRDGFECQYCGVGPSVSPLQVDHIHPVKEGGDNSPDNLVTSCQPCNIGKGATTLNKIPESLKAKATSIKDHEEQIKAYSMVMIDKRKRIESEVWMVADIFVDNFRSDTIRTEYLTSIKTFNSKLSVFKVMDAMEVATSRNIRSQSDTFKYFCGICWGIIRGADNGQS